MELDVPFTTRQLDLLREARDRDAPGQSIEEFIVSAFVAEAERERVDALGEDGPL